MKRAVVICPGRGTYNKDELGYLTRHFPDKELLSSFDEQRTQLGLEKLLDLDGADRFSMAKHTRGDNASALIFAATLGDFMSINKNEVEIVAVTGNSMGWYSALACAGALAPNDGFKVANTMGYLMQQALIGGQLVYPHMNDDWHPDLARLKGLLDLVAEIATRQGHILAPSIDLGGMLVIAGNEEGLSAFEKAVDVIQGRFPMRLGNHAAFHTSLQTPVAAEGRGMLSADLFRQPTIPMIDGRGKIWWPDQETQQDLWDYTLNHQVVEMYDFTNAIRVAAREFAPDYFIVTGPGNTLGGAVAQSLILSNWQGLSCKDDFKTLQQQNGLLISMGMAEQRKYVV
jgi:malonyl CoA-acyl carrier protein transacylase